MLRQLWIEEWIISGRDVRAPGARASRPQSIHHFNADRALAVLNCSVAAQPSPKREGEVFLRRVGDVNPLIDRVHTAKSGDLRPPLADRSRRHLAENKTRAA